MTSYIVCFGNKQTHQLEFIKVLADSDEAAVIQAKEVMTSAGLQMADYYLNAAGINPTE